MKLVFVSIPTYVRQVPKPDASLRRARRTGEALIFRHAGLYVDNPASRSLCRGLWALASACRRLGHAVHWIDAGDGLLDSQHTQAELHAALQGADQLWLYAMTSTFADCLQIAHAAKQRNPHLTVLLGGPHASACAREILQQHSEISVVSTGFQPSDLLASWAERWGEMPGTACRADDGAFRCTPGANASTYVEICDPDVLARPMAEYHINVSSSVGCSFSCNFCVDGDQSLRTRELSGLFEELRYYDRVLKPGTVVHFFDTIFGLPKPHFAQVSEFISREIHNIQFSCDVKANVVNDELARQLHRCRVRFVSMGVETSAPQVLQITKKRQDFAECIAAAQTLRRHMPGALIKGYWILGLPGTTPQTAAQDLDAAKELIQSGVFDILSPKFFVPYPGTSYFESPQAHGLLLHTRDFQLYDRFQVPPVCTPKSMSQDMLTALLGAYEEFLARHYAQRLGRTLESLMAQPTVHARYNGPLYDATPVPDASGLAPAPAQLSAGTDA